MRTFTVGLLFFLSVPLASGTFQPTRELDFWRGTGLNLAQARRFFANTTCLANDELFEGCALAFAKAGAMLDTPEFDDLRSQTRKAQPAVDFDRLLTRVEQLVSVRPAKFPIEMVFGEMINTLLRQFDPHASLLPNEYLNSLYATPVRDTIGIGIEKEINAAGLFIRRVYPGSPAEAAGLVVNDRIVAVHGEQMTVERAGKSVTVQVLSAHLSLPEFTLGFEQFGKSMFAFARLRTFGRGVCANLREQLSLVHGQIDGVVLDLRGNLGGALNEAACVMSLFAKQKEFVQKKPLVSSLPAAALGLNLSFSEEDQEHWRSRLGPTLFATLPLAVIVNASSASASEMLAAALQDHHRAWVVGEMTYGKGSTQAVIPHAHNSNLSLVYTVSRYYRPSGGPLQLIGVTPNFLVPFERLATPAERRFPREGEFYGNKLQREDVPPWKESRQSEVRAIRSCLKKSKSDLWFNSALIKKNGFEDFQKASALGVLHCSPPSPKT